MASLITNKHIDLDNITRQQLVLLDEGKLRLEVIIPVLEYIGFRNIVHCHGANECGIDIFFETSDFFGRCKYFGISAKKGDIKKASYRTSRSIQAILAQIDEAFTTPFYSSNITKVFFARILYNSFRICHYRRKRLYLHKEWEISLCRYNRRTGTNTDYKRSTSPTKKAHRLEDLRFVCRK